jgi:hypothetical protein
MEARMRLPDREHTSRPWRIHELTRDFRVEDVWAVPVAGGRDDFPRLVAQLAGADPSRGSSRVSRMLWTARSTIGELLSWDGPGTGLGSRVTTLRERLPADLRSTPGPDFAALPFTSLYLLDDEFAAEIANHTVHGVMHLGWVPDGKGAYRGQLAVLVKPNGLPGAGYLAAIKPFRHLIVYPRMMRDLARQWRDDAATPTASSASGMAMASGTHESHAGSSGQARQIDLPPGARALSTLSRIDYGDAFFVSTGPGRDRTGEEWARAVLEGTPQKVRVRLLRGWCLLGLRLGSPRSRRRILGWQVRRCSPDFVLLAAGSRIGMPAELLFKREGHGLLFATFVQQRNSLARIVWARVVPAHQRTVSYLLEQAAGRESQGYGNCP